MNTGDRLTISITDIAYRGRALGRHEGEVVFVYGALPGETVEVEVAALAKNFAEATLLRVLTPSPNRIEPACPLAAGCPGCRYQHVSYEAELAIKNGQLVNLLGRLARVDAAVCGAPVPSPFPAGYRNKIVLHAWMEEGERLLGYFSEDNRTVLDVPRCPLASDSINARLADLRADDAFMVSLETHNKVTIRETGFDGVQHWVGAVHDQGRPWLTERTPVGEVQVPRGSFFQVNRSVADLLLGEVDGHIRTIAPDSFVDVYGGVGLFAFMAGRQGVERVCSLDLDGASAEAGRHNARRLGLGNVEFVSGPAQKKLASVLMALRGGRTAVVVDPPRTGLEPGTLRTLVRGEPAGIIYVSCAPDTLARDLKQLAAAGYHVKQTRLFDMFPRTPFFETVTLLQRDAK
jgi:tRNA/tmRNA/rRNA uracil-C5-methylase (TrmA/RlmC/RlmD family)